MPKFLESELISRLESLTTVRKQLIDERYRFTSFEIASYEKDFSLLAGWFLFYNIPISYSEKKKRYIILDQSIKEEIVDSDVGRWIEELSELNVQKEKTEQQERRIVQLLSFLEEKGVEVNRKENERVKIMLSRLPFKGGKLPK